MIDDDATGIPAEKDSVRCCSTERVTASDPCFTAIRGDAAARSAILVVDDDADCCLVMKDILEDLGYQVDTARDSVGALALVRGHSYRIVLVDLYLPGSDGLTFIKLMRTLTSQLPAVIVTGDPTDPRVAEARNDGVTGVVSKPVDISRLRTIINGALGTTVTDENQPAPRQWAAQNDWLEFLEAEIHQSTGRRVRHLKVSRGAQGLIVSAQVATYYLKQLVIHAALRATGGTVVVDFDVDVTS